MVEIETVLAAWLTHIQNQPVDKHPTVWAQHYDVWLEPVGDLGARSVDDETVIGVLTPFVVVPTVGVAALVVDRAEQRRIDTVVLSAFTNTPHVSARRFPYTVSDWGLVSVGPGWPLALASDLATPVQVVRQGRMLRVGWEDEWTYDASLAAVADWLDSI